MWQVFFFDLCYILATAGSVVFYFAFMFVYCATDFATPDAYWIVSFPLSPNSPEKLKTLLSLSSLFFKTRTYSLKFTCPPPFSSFLLLLPFLRVS